MLLDLPARPERTGPPPPPGVVDLPERYNAVADLLDAPVEHGARDGTALVPADAPGEAVSYGTLASRVARVGSVLAELGVRPEERVALLADDAPAWVAALLGVVRAGSVAVPLSTMLPTGQLVPMLDATRPRLVLLDPERAGEVREVTARLGGGTRVASLDEFAEGVAAARPVPPAGTLRDQPALVLFTSGTTGSPKGAVHAHGDLAVARCFAAVMGYGAGDRLWSTSKLFFAYTLGSTVTTGLSAGCSIVLARGRVTPERMAEVARRVRPTVVSSVPTLYARLLHSGVDPSAFASLRAFVSAGERLPGVVLDGMRERFPVPVLEHLGSTEYIHPFTATRPGDVVAGSVGPAMPGITVAVLDGDRHAEPGEPGELWVRGPGVMDGYLHQRAATQRALAGGWLRTGDRVRADERGRLTVLGRSDDLLLVAGMKVSPLEIEAALLAHPGVQEVAVAGAQDPDGLVQPWAFVVLAPGVEPREDLAEALRAAARQRLPGYARPQAIRFVPELPRTATGKLQRFRLAERATLELDGPP